MKEGRRQGGGRTEEIHLNGHSKGMHNPEFRRAEIRNLEFKLYLSEKIINSSSVLPDILLYYKCTIKF
jgi:hypothetical protein